MNQAQKKNSNFQINRFGYGNGKKPINKRKKLFKSEKMFKPKNC